MDKTKDSSTCAQNNGKSPGKVKVLHPKPRRQSDDVTILTEESTGTGSQQENGSKSAKHVKHVESCKGGHSKIISRRRQRHICCSPQQRMMAMGTGVCLALVAIAVGSSFLVVIKSISRLRQRGSGSPAAAWPDKNNTLGGAHVPIAPNQTDLPILLDLDSLPNQNSSGTSSEKNLGIELTYNAQKEDQQEAQQAQQDQQTYEEDSSENSVGIELEYKEKQEQPYEEIFVIEPAGPDTRFEPGNLSHTQHGIRLSRGLKLRLLAQSGDFVEYGEQRDGRKSSERFHKLPDGAATITISDEDGGGFIYVSNSEAENGEGGVGAIKFDKDGYVTDFQMVLKDTTRNCSGGLTPWGTWVSRVFMRCSSFAAAFFHDIERALILTRILRTSGSLDTYTCRSAVKKTGKGVNVMRWIHLEFTVHNKLCLVGRVGILKRWPWTIAISRNQFSMSRMTLVMENFDNFLLILLRWRRLGKQAIIGISLAQWVT
jgi:hypothetical protein